ncbi:MAG TPA: SDR family oxidoreductase [Acidimicrobiales bacterium]|jgi:NAD(P)-dependent dehydrogenase (short-subunit alcohol dehydrogenase family)|nr:SDR family oxidoreductase [Acidimicrobiales bacterium]
MSTELAWAPGPGVSVFADGVFADQVAVVTGGGTGLGREVALSFAALGAQVVIAGRTATSLEEVSGTITDLGGRCRAVPTNIRELEEVEALRDSVYAEFGRVDYLINNAGGQFPALPSDISDNGWRAVVDLNLNGTWNMTNRFMQPMTEAGFGAIVNVVHTFSFERGAPMFAHSGAARAGVVNLVKTLAPYLMRRGVTINAFAPGIFATPGMVVAELETIGHTEQSFTDELVSEGTTVRMGTVDEMAAMVLFLCSPAARYVSGSTIIADGASMQSNWVSFFPEGEM